MKSYPFTSQVTYDDNGLPKYDRAVNSEFLRKVYAQYFSDGVFYDPASALQVTVDTGMNVRVAPGACHIQGAMAIETEPRVLAVQASGELDRIDTVVARLDLSLAVRSIDLYVLKGTPGETPAAPALTRNNTVWELGLADLFVAKNTTSISQQRITDTRLNAARCGQVMVPLAPADFDPYFAQLQAAIATHDTEAQAQIAELERVIRGIEAGSETMLKAIYDPQQRAADVFAAVDTAKGQAIAAALAVDTYVYTGRLLVDGWVAGAEANGTAYWTQTVAATSVDGGPAITAATQLLGPMALPTGVRETDEVLAEVLRIVNNGITTTGAGTVTCKVWELPEADAQIYWPGKAGA